MYENVCWSHVGNSKVYATAMEKNHKVLQEDGKQWLFFFCPCRLSCAKNALPVCKFFTFAAGAVVFLFLLLGYLNGSKA
jgi:hypothetical protein